MIVDTLTTPLIEEGITLLQHQKTNNNSFITMIANVMPFHLIKVKNECVIRLVEPLPL